MSTTHPASRSTCCEAVPPSATIPRMAKSCFRVPSVAGRAACAASLIVAFLGGCGEKSLTRHVTLHECRLPKLISAAQCATVDVPEDRSKPGGRTIALSVAVLPANTLNPDADPLFMLPGGPGQSGEALVPVATALDGVRRTRDIVLIDPRGGGKSGPLKCAALAPRDALDDLVAADLGAAAAPRCLAELRSSGDRCFPLQHDGNGSRRRRGPRGAGL